MTSMLPRGAPPTPRRRCDYRPPSFLIDDVELTFDLDPDATEVTATYAFRRNPSAVQSDRRAPLTLDGEQQERLHVVLDGRALPRERLLVEATSLTIADAPDCARLHFIRPAARVMTRVA